MLKRSLGIPGDLKSGIIVAVLNGNQSLHIENHRGILQFEKDCIKILARPGRVEITGTLLCIDFYNDEEINISGRITGIQYC